MIKKSLLVSGIVLFGFVMWHRLGSTSAAVASAVTSAKKPIAIERPVSPQPKPRLPIDGPQAQILEHTRHANPTDDAVPFDDDLLDTETTAPLRVLMSEAAAERDALLQQMAASAVSDEHFEAVKRISTSWRQGAYLQGIALETSEVQCYADGCYASGVFSSLDEVDQFTAITTSDPVANDWPAIYSSGAILKNDESFEVTWFFYANQNAQARAQELSIQLASRR